MENSTYSSVLSIAGSDPSGGAGIQADIKTISACGCYASTAIVAVVDENTVGVTGVHPVPLDFVKGQIISVLGDVGADAIKIGMLHSSELIEGVRNTLDKYPEITDIVVDPVMVATSGDPLLEENAQMSLREILMPRARVITPNIPEAEILLGERIREQKSLPDVARKLADRCGGVSVFLKAGHLSDSRVIDVFYNAETDSLIRLESSRLSTRNTHGTGCTLSSALASFLAKGVALDDAARGAKEYIVKALEAGANYKIGNGHGPVHHFFGFWS